MSALLGEIAIQFRLRLLRSVLSMGLGAVAVGSFVFLVVALGQSRLAVDEIFEQNRPRLISLDSALTEGGFAADPGVSAEARERVREVRGVQSGGRFWIHAAPDAKRSAADAGRPLVPLVAADPQAAAALGAAIGQGRWPADSHLPQAAMTRLAAERIGIMDGVHLPFGLLIDGATQLSVVGIVEADPTRPEYSSVVYVSPAAALAGIESDENARGGYVLRTEPDGIRDVARAAVLAARPDDPDSMRAAVPPDPVRLRDLVDRRVQVVLIGVGVAAGILGIVAIAINSLAMVIERRMELAVRLALGSSPARLGIETLLQSVFLGVLAGLVGSSLGTGAGIVFGTLNDWPQVFIWWLAPLAVVAGLIAGAGAGLLPAAATTRVDPAAVLRSA